MGKDNFGLVKELAEKLNGKTESEIEKLASVYCYQVHYMNKDVHRFILIEWTDEYVKFKWKQDGKWHRATKYFNATNSKERWFKTEKEAIEFVSNNYDAVFINNL